MLLLYNVQYAEYPEYVQYTKYNKYDEYDEYAWYDKYVKYTEYANPFRICTSPLEYTHTPFYITNMTNMQEICNKYTHTLFLYSKKYQIWKNMQNMIFTHPALPQRYGRVWGKTLWQILRNIRNMQNFMFWKGMFLCLFASSIDCTTSGSESMCRSTQQWCRGHVRSADCIQVRPVFVK